MGFKTFINWHSLTEYRIKMMFNRCLHHFTPADIDVLALHIPINGVTTDIYPQMFSMLFIDVIL